MLNVLVAGYGKMGKMIVETIEQSDDMKVVMIADGTNHPDVSTYRSMWISSLTFLIRTI